jgi:pyruvate,water dikinase
MAGAGSPPAERPPLVVPLERLRRSDLALAGAKAVNLGEMLHTGLPVPAGFCVTTAAYGLWLDSFRPARSSFAALDALTAAPTEEFRRKAAELRQALGALPFPEPVARAVRAAVQAYRHRPAAGWAVRSSATGEDTPGTSFAGQHESFLGVGGDDSRGGGSGRDRECECEGEGEGEGEGEPALCEAVRQCWISLFTDRALFYRRKHGLRSGAAAMAVVVQVMVPADAAGVLFTADPVTGDRERLVIEAVRGLGETLVAGRVTPARFVMEKETLEVSAGSGEPVHGLPAGNRRERETTEEETEVRDNPGPTPPCFDAASLRGLGELARRVECLFGAPQDLEWATCQGNFFLLQARPITRLPPPPDPEPNIWTNANAMEALPGVVTPMTWSFMQILVDHFLHPLLRRVGLDTDKRPLVGLIAGRAYLNARTVVEFPHWLAGSGVAEVTALFGGQPAVQRELQRAAARRKRAFTLRSVPRLFGVACWLLRGLWRQQRLLEEWRELTFAGLSGIDPGALSDEGLAGYPGAIVRRASAGAGERTWAAAIWMAITGVGGSAVLHRLTRRWLGDTDGALANQLLSGAGGMNSAENGLALLRLAAWVREQPQLAAALLKPGAWAIVAPRLGGVPGGLELLDRWQTFMARHGHQARGGMDIAQPRWSELPDVVFDQLRAYLQFDETSDPLASQARRREKRGMLLEDCRRRLRNPCKRWLLRFLLGAAQRGLVQRENVKNEGVRMVAIIRRLLLEAGRRLVQRGLLAQADEVFFLHFEELAPALCRSKDFDVPATVAARKTERARLEQMTPPATVIGTYVPETSVPEDLPAEARRLQGVAVSPGVVTGKARVILHADAEAHVLPGEILVAPWTDPGWTPLFLAAAGVVVDVGGQLSHGSVVAREYGLPAVVNVGPATRLIQTGQRLCVDGHRGVVTLLD